MDYIGLAAILIAIALLMSMTLRRYRQRPASVRVERPSARPRSPLAYSARRDMEQLMVELEELSRRVSAQIETRYRKLETVIADADDRLHRLDEVLNQINRAQANAGSAPSDDREAPATPTKIASLKPDTTEVRSPHERVHALADGGASIAEIAHATSRSTGEVELILDLRSASEDESLRAADH
ncbi:MAG: hypothetical protein V3T70_10570 [Phycisphaerae bacterium]